MRLTNQVMMIANTDKNKSISKEEWKKVYKTIDKYFDETRDPRTDLSLEDLSNYISIINSNKG